MKKNKKGLILILLMLSICTLVGIMLFVFLYNRKIVVNDIDVNDDSIVFSLNRKSSCKVNEEAWQESKDNKCIYAYQDYINTIYLKNKYGKVFTYKIDKDFTVVKDITLNIYKTYLAIGDKDFIKVNILSKGNIKDKVVYSSEDENIAQVSDDGVITGIGNGHTRIVVKLRDNIKYIEVIVTDLIITKPDEFDSNREYLSCERYTESENDLLDDILKYRIERVGYKTRASVVEAARFITLEFPYRLTYFSENGRAHPYGATSLVDGEGRYYHEGLYLHSSRFSKVSPTMHGPGIWGCMVYSNPSAGYRRNGLDCSGFVSWILLNGGFDAEDLGAGVSTIQDLTDLGERKYLSDAISNNTIRVGDLLSGKGSDGGHIAILVGIKDGYYYVAESLWSSTGYFGPLIRKYTGDDITNYFYWQVDMESYYEGDGDLTDFWK